MITIWLQITGGGDANIGDYMGNIYRLTINNQVMFENYLFVQYLLYFLLYFYWGLEMSKICKEYGKVIKNYYSNSK